MGDLKRVAAEKFGEKAPDVKDQELQIDGVSKSSRRRATAEPIADVQVAIVGTDFTKLQDTAIGNRCTVAVCGALRCEL